MVDKILEEDEGHVNANYLKGRLLLLKRDYSTALEHFELVVRERPQSAMAHYFRALSLMGKGEFKLAQRDLVKAVELNPKDFESWLSELERINVIIPFNHNGEHFYYIRKFTYHQTINRPSKQRSR